MELDDPVQTIAGVGPSRARALEGAGIFTVGDLLTTLPQRYEDRSRLVTIGELAPGMASGVVAEVTACRRVGPGRRARVEATVRDATGILRLVWFNQPYMADRLTVGEQVRLFGLPRAYEGALQMANPVLGDPDPEADSVHLGRLVPVYRSIGSLGPGALRRLVATALEAEPTVPDPLPEADRDRLTLQPLADAIRDVHYPPVGADVEACCATRSEAHRRLVVGELVDALTALRLQRRRAIDRQRAARAIAGDVRTAVEGALPFRLTAAQDRCVDEILSDLGAATPMHRLVQGDVGSGKTAVAGCAMLALALAGEQAAMLAPTSILARQHGDTFARWATQLGLRAALLTGATAPAERAGLLAALATGEVDLVVGTQALLQPDVRFDGLGLVVVDEQHRLGVDQRLALAAKGGRDGCPPDLLVMTATPIPRSLALTLYGDLDSSRIDEMPPGRGSIETEVLAADDRAAVVEAVRATVDAGQRAFVVAPRIEGDDTASAEGLHAELRRRLPGVAVGLVHGGLAAADKERVVAGVRTGDVPVLVATTVIEVGVDVPEATLMVIEHAEQYGLAQLHQLRGRVGRGPAGGRCLLLAHEPMTDAARVRLATLVATTDGFAIAETDLELRGAGEILGSRQTGDHGFRIADPVLHADWLVDAHATARRLAEADDAQAAAFRARLRREWKQRMRRVHAG